MCVEISLRDLPKGMASLIRGLSREQGFGVVDGGVRDETSYHEEHQEYPEPVTKKRKARKLSTVEAVVVPRTVVKMKGGLLGGFKKKQR